MNSITRINSAIIVCLLASISPCIAQQSTHPPSIQAESGLERYGIFRRLFQTGEAVDETELDRQATKEARRVLPTKVRHAISEEQVAVLDLPQDTTTRLSVRQIRITGNALISTEDLLAGVPLVYNASLRPLVEAQSQDLYDLRAIRRILAQPDQPVDISLRTIQGLTQYVLSVYQDSHYSGIYVYVPEGAIRDGVALVDQILPIRVIEATVSEVGAKFYDSDGNEVEDGILRRSALDDWSAVEAGTVANQRKLDYMLNLLNLDPDRYITAVVSPGSEPNTLAVEYNVYETNPWHFFIQADNSGTDERQWSPRFGLINTNLLGFDDRFTALYQATPDSHFDENYSFYGSYDFPVMGPRLRLNLYGGYSEFDINPGSGPFDFIGAGEFYGGVLRYNAFQQGGWFFDITGSLSHEESKVKPSLFPQFFSSDVEMDLLGVGANIHHRDDMSSTSLTFNRVQSIGGSCQRRFWDYLNLMGARTNAEKEFVIYSASANHSEYLDQNKVQQLRGSFRWIRPDERLVPAKMTSFGGMYSVRGYDEYEIVADGGILASLQYEYDLVRDSSVVEQEDTSDHEFRKLAPLAFVDYGRARIEDRVLGEREHQTLCSVGAGLAFEYGEHLLGALYLGCPLKATAGTRRCKGRLSAGVTVRW